MYQSLISFCIVLASFSVSTSAEAATIDNPLGSTIEELVGTAAPDSITNNGSVTSDIKGTVNSAGLSGGSNTISNSGSVGRYIFGSLNSGDKSSGGSNTISNSGSVENDIYGSVNNGLNSIGGSNTINNSGSVEGRIYGSRNYAANNIGGSNTIINSGSVEGRIYGSLNIGENSSGGSNTIINSGSVGDTIYGSANNRANSSGGLNTISNSGTVRHGIHGSRNVGANSSGGFNIISNSWTVGDEIYGSYNYGENSSGGSNTIINSGTVGDIYGSLNSGDKSSGGSNTIINSGSVKHSIYGSDNIGLNSSGGSNAIVNSGRVSFILGNQNHALGSIGGSNVISNSGSVGDIYGSLNSGDKSSGGSNIISNSNLVGGSIYGSDNGGLDSVGGSNAIVNSGRVSFILGSQNHALGSIGGSNIISNSGSVGYYIYGSANYGKNSSGGSNIISNSGSVEMAIAGSLNIGTNSSGGSNTIINSGSVGYGIAGSDNSGENSIGGSNTIINSGSVESMIYGSLNFGENSSGGSNTIINSGYVGGDIWGSKNDGVDSRGGDDTITNRGTVMGSIYGADGNDTIIIAGGSVVGGVVDGGLGNDTLGFDSIGEVDDSIYLGFENLAIFGGSNTLSGSWGFEDGSTNILAGSLNVDGNLTTTILTVGSASVLEGSGLITGQVVTYGTISPGNSIGTLNIDGSVRFMPGSAYLVELSSRAGGDLLKVSGPVSISGGRLAVSLDRALYPNGKNWRIIEAGGGINGTFSSISSNSYTIGFRQSVSSGALVLVVDRTPYATFGTTANQVAVGSGLDALLPSAHGAMANLLVSMDFDMNQSQIGATLAGLNPEIYTSFPTAGLETAGIFGQTVNQRQQELRTKYAFTAEEKTTSGWNVWARALGNRSEHDSAQGIDGYSLETGGGIIGMDRNFNTASRAGMLLGYSDGDLDAKASSASGTITSKHLGFYGTTGYKDFYVDGYVGYTALNNSSDRWITTPLFSRKGGASFDSNVWSGSLTGGYDFTFGTVRVGPVAAVNYQHLDQDAFIESTTIDFAQKIDGSDADSLTSTLGLQLGGLITRGDWHFSPRGSLGWIHQFKEDAVVLNAAFTDYPSASFKVTGASPLADQLLLTTGLSIDYGTNLSLYADYSLTDADGQSSQLLSFGLGWLF